VKKKNPFTFYKVLKSFYSTLKVKPFLCLLMLISLSSLAQPTQISSSMLEKTQSHLKQVFKRYHLKSMQIQITQEIFLSGFSQTIKSKGLLYLKRKKFRLQLNGTPPALLLFDNRFLWYQADTNEKLVFRLKNPSPTQVLTHFFLEENFFKNFKILQAKQKGSNYILHVLPKIKNENLKEIFIKTGTYISEIRLIWKDLGSWQKYKFSKPLHKEISDQKFKFISSGFQVVDKTGL